MAGVRNCQGCGTLVAANTVTCPHCGQPTMTKLEATGSLLQNLGCLIMLVVFVIVPLCVMLWACATS